MGEIQDILVNVGAIAGVAAIVGIAVLAMLYFSQARDVRRLREWAGREPERAAEVELRAQQIASQAIAQAYQSMAVRQSEAVAAAGIAQEHGVEVDPALAEQAAAVEHGVTDDQLEIPEVAALAGEEGGGEEHDPQATQAHDVLAEDEAEEGVPADVEPAVAAAAPAGQEDVAQTPAPEDAEQAEEGERVAEPVASNGTAEHAQAPAPATSHLAPSTPAAARAAAPLPPLPPLDTSEFSAISAPLPPVDNRPPTPDIPDYYYGTGTTASGAFEPVIPPEEPRNRTPFVIAGILVGIFAIVLFATQVLGGDDEPANKNAQEQRQQRDSQSTAERSPQVNRAAVTISVLNGTDTSGLAKLAGDGLQKAGFTDVTTGNRNDGVNHPTSTVYYASGNKIEAQEVANELKISDVKEADDAILAAGGSVPVIVVLGADFDQ